MSLYVFKYPLALKPVQTVLMPKGGEILCLQSQGGGPTIWARVDDAIPLKTRVIYLVGTGQSAPDGPYIGTVQQDGFVWHFFDGGEV